MVDYKSEYSNSILITIKYDLDTEGLKALCINFKYNIIYETSNSKFVNCAINNFIG